MKLSNLVNLLPILVTFIACTHSDNDKLIMGNWKGIQWLVNGKPSNLDAQNTFFTFNAKGDYTYTYAGEKEAGTYKVENNNLFTTPLNQQEIMVKINKLTSDSLIFEMNRSGQPELLVLIKN